MVFVFVFVFIVVTVVTVVVVFVVVVVIVIVIIVVVVIIGLEVSCDDVGGRGGGGITDDVVEGTEKELICHLVVGLAVASLMAALLTMLSADSFAVDRLVASLVAVILTMPFADSFADNLLVTSLMAALLTMLSADFFSVDWWLVASLVAALLTIPFADPFAVDRLVASLVAALLTMLSADAFADDLLVASLVARGCTSHHAICRRLCCRSACCTPCGCTSYRVELPPPPPFLCVYDHAQPPLPCIELPSPLPPPAFLHVYNHAQPPSPCVELPSPPPPHPFAAALPPSYLLLLLSLFSFLEGFRFKPGNFHLQIYFLHSGIIGFHGEHFQLPFQRIDFDGFMKRCNFDMTFGLPLILDNFHCFKSLIAMVNDHHQWPSPNQQFIKCKRHRIIAHCFPQILIYIMQVEVDPILL